ncbi:MAG: hypothetical protein HZB52_00005 [Chloroflexi bacterium]|nr:hypothetical protein [Chloroflexota bacterium]
MKKKTPLNPIDDMRSEYDFSGGVRGKHYKARMQGYTIKIHKADGTPVVQQIKPDKAVKLAPDVREYFPNSQSVNRALRGLILLVPAKRKIAAPKSRGRKLVVK